jgi:hypothetical protein
MAETPTKTPANRDWRFALSIGLAIGLGLAVARNVKEALVPSLGDWGAFTVSLLAAGATGGLVALAVHWLIRPRGSSHH